MKSHVVRLKLLTLVCRYYMWLQPWVGRLLSKSIETCLNMVLLKIYYYKKNFRPLEIFFCHDKKIFSSLFLKKFLWISSSKTIWHWFMQQKISDFYEQKTHCVMHPWIWINVGSSGFILNTFLPIRNSSVMI